MLKIFTGFSALLLTGAILSAQNVDGYTYEWVHPAMNASRTGVKFLESGDVESAMGSVKGRTYVSPSGRKFKKGVTPKVAGIMIGAQDEMARVKQVIGYSTKEMIRQAPESAISDWFIDALMEICREEMGVKVDMGIVNFGGIRVDMPQGNVLLDDILSMFPFKNNLAYVQMKGKDVRNMLERMAKYGWQVIGGVRCLATADGRLVSAEIGGKPIEDDALYGIATISFLLNGGDGFGLAKNAVSVKVSDNYVMDVMVPYVERLTAEGKNIEYEADGRVTIIK